MKYIIQHNIFHYALINDSNWYCKMKYCKMKYCKMKYCKMDINYNHFCLDGDGDNDRRFGIY